MQKVTKKDRKAFIKMKLASDRQWAYKALLKILDQQTLEEINTETTNKINGVGFTGVDAPLLTSFAKQLQTKGSLSTKQEVYLFKKMPKYWEQILHISKESQIDVLINQSKK